MTRTTKMTETVMAGQGASTAGVSRTPGSRIAFLGFMGKGAAFLVSAFILIGCSVSSYLDTNQAAALTTAENRGKFELNCQQVNATLISRKIIQPWIGGIERCEYTIGVRGCGRQAVYLTICLDQENCNAISDTGHVAQTLQQEP